MACSHIRKGFFISTSIPKNICFTIKPKDICYTFKDDFFAFFAMSKNLTIQR